MSRIPHGSARTTEAVRRAMQHSQESLRALAKRYGVKCWTSQPEQFKLNPLQKMPGLNI